MLGTFLVNSMPAKILFDSGASHSFVMETFMDKGNLKPSHMDKLMIVQIPGSTAKTQLSCRNVPVELHRVHFHADLIILGTKGLDVVLGMDWMSKYQGHIDCARKCITVTNSKGMQIEHIATMPSTTRKTVTRSAPIIVTRSACLRTAGTTPLVICYP
jgi:hypothetical protein